MRVSELGSGRRRRLCRYKGRLIVDVRTKRERERKTDIGAVPPLFSLTAHTVNIESYEVNEP